MHRDILQNLYYWLKESVYIYNNIYIYYYILRDYIYIYILKTKLIIIIVDIISLKLLSSYYEYYHHC